MTNKGFYGSFDDVWMIDGVRTPMVDYCSHFGGISPTDLGIKVAREALLRSGVPAADIGSVITGNMAPGDFFQFVLPRHIGLYAGVPLAAARSVHGPARILMNCAGIGGARRLVGKDGKAMPLADFARIVNVNLIGTFNAIRLAAADMLALEPLEDMERGVIVCTSSVAAYDGQVGQAAYAASKGGITALTLPLARDLAQFGVRVMTIAPGLFMTPLLFQLPEEVQQSLGASIPFPKRLGKAGEFAQLALHIAGNLSLNGEVIRLDGALRLPPR